MFKNIAIFYSLDAELSYNYILLVCDNLEIECEGDDSDIQKLLIEHKILRRERNDMYRLNIDKLVDLETLESLSKKLMEMEMYLLLVIEENDYYHHTVTVDNDWEYAMLLHYLGNQKLLIPKDLLQT